MSITTSSIKTPATRPAEIDYTSCSNCNGLFSVTSRFSQNNGQASYVIQSTRADVPWKTPENCALQGSFSPETGIKVTYPNGQEIYGHSGDGNFYVSFTGDPTKNIKPTITLRKHLCPAKKEMDPPENKNNDHVNTSSSSSLNPTIIGEWTNCSRCNESNFSPFNSLKNIDASPRYTHLIAQYSETPIAILVSKQSIKINDQTLELEEGVSPEGIFSVSANPLKSGPEFSVDRTGDHVHNNPKISKPSQPQPSSSQQGKFSSNNPNNTNVFKASPPPQSQASPRPPTTTKRPTAPQSQPQPSPRVQVYDGDSPDEDDFLKYLSKKANVSQSSQPQPAKSSDIISLLAAITSEQKSKVQRLLSQGIIPNEQCFKVAIALDNSSIVSSLCQKGRPTTQNLLDAILFDYKDIVGLLLIAHAMPDEDCFAEAIQNENPDIVSLLAKEGLATNNNLRKAIESDLDSYKMVCSILSSGVIPDAESLAAAKASNDERIYSAVSDRYNAYLKKMSQL